MKNVLTCVFISLFLTISCVTIENMDQETTDENHIAVNETQATNEEYSFTGLLTNGLIDGKQLAYTTTAAFDGENVSITFDAGIDFEWVWLYAPEHVSMVNNEGTAWSAILPSHSPGSTLSYYFTVRKNGQEANNSDTAHKWRIVQTGSNSSVPVSETGAWQLVWEDDFSGSGQPNPANWSYHVGNGFNKDTQTFMGWGNGEWEWYMPQNAYVENGNLVIRADYASNPTDIAGRNNYQFSGRITTQGKHSWKYGRIEARIAMPKANGSWPAFWLLGEPCDMTYTEAYEALSLSYYDTMASNWSSCGEIDIIEHRNLEDSIVQNLFWDTRNGLFPWSGEHTASNPSENIPVTDVSEFHLYTLEWDANEIRWYVDRLTNPLPTKRHKTGNDQEEFHRRFFIILNLAIQGQFTGPIDPVKNDFPLFMFIDYVRVWQMK